MTKANWSYPTSIRFGSGRILELGDACQTAGIRKPLLVTDKGLANMEITNRALDNLNNSGLGRAIFADVDPNPNEKNMEAGIKAFKAGGHDGVIAFGGGSGLDLGKLVAFMAGQTRPVWDFEDIDDWWTRADSKGIRPVIAVPTTAGTGSEVGRAGVLTNSATHVKKIIFHPKMLPAVAILDPELTVGMPRHITVGTGMDALVHCIEAFSSPFYHPMSQGVALEGIKLVKENLPIVYQDGKNLEARGHMMSAASMGAVSFQKGLGAAHALSHPIGALYNTHHGMTNAVVLPAVLKMNRPAIEARINQAAGYLGIAGGFDGFYDFIIGLSRSLGVPDKLGGLKVDGSRIDEIVRMALEDPSAGGNPVKMTADNTKKLLKACL